MEGLLAPGLCDEVATRVRHVQSAIRQEGFSALLVYGNNKISGSLRYLTGYWPDRAGWDSAPVPMTSDARQTGHHRRRGGRAVLYQACRSYRRRERAPRFG